MPTHLKSAEERQGGALLLPPTVWARGRHVALIRLQMLVPAWPSFGLHPLESEDVYTQHHQAQRARAKVRSELAWGNPPLPQVPPTKGKEIGKRTGFSTPNPRTLICLVPVLPSSSPKTRSGSNRRLGVGSAGGGGGKEQKPRTPAAERSGSYI